MNEIKEPQRTVTTFIHIPVLYVYHPYAIINLKEVTTAAAIAKT